MEIKNLKINVLGDSITEGCGTSDKSHRFTELIQNNYGAVCRNYGIGGTRIARQQRTKNYPVDCDYCSRISEMDPDADVVIVFGGTNDYGHGDAPIGCFEDRTPDTFYGAMHYLCENLITKYPCAKIFFITPIHRINEWELKDIVASIDAVPLKRYVEIIREVTEYYSLPVLDLYKGSGLQPEVPVIRELYVPDGLHPNDAGHKIIAEKIVKFIENM